MGQDNMSQYEAKIRQDYDKIRQDYIKHDQTG